MIRTITRKAYLSKQAHNNLGMFLGQARYLYNESLAERRDAWEQDKKSITYIQQAKLLTERRKDPEWCKFSVMIQQNILRRLDKAYQSFFRKGGYPRFKSWDNGIHSFEDSLPKKIKNTGKHYSYYIKGIGRLKFKDGLPEGKVKIVRVVKTSLRIKLQFVMELKDEVITDNRPPLGIDVGIKDRITLSNGVKSPKNTIDRNELKRKQRILSRAKRGSNNRRKKKELLKREWQRVTEREKGKLHELTTMLVKKQSNSFVVEDLRISNMVKNKRLSRSIMEQQWWTFVNMLDYKALSAGGQVIKVSPKNTTQECSVCGAMPQEKITLKDRVYNCGSCGQSMDRDLNAARNILFKAKEVFDLGGNIPGMKEECEPLEVANKSAFTS